MAKPIIHFKGAKFTAGGVVGYRPQLEKAEKVTDYAIAEAVVLERGLTMSPDELLMAVRSTLETVPQMIAADGRNREITGALIWKRAATGRLNGPGGPWNDTCKSKINVALAKACKLEINANFVNENESPIPKISNICYVGAQVVTDVIQPGNKFVVYGRNVIFKPTYGDTAKLWLNGTDYALTADETDTAHTRFTWPSSFPTVEAGTTIEFEMQTCGGVEGAGKTLCSRQVVAVNPAAPTKLLITIEDFRNDVSEPTVGRMLLSGQNFQGALGWDTYEQSRYVDGYITVNDGTETQVMFADDAQTGTFIGTYGMGYTTGDIVRITLKPDPAKAALYQQTPATAQFVVA